MGIRVGLGALPSWIGGPGTGPVIYFGSSLGADPDIAPWGRVWDTLRAKSEDHNLMIFSFFSVSLKCSFHCRN